jgi:hypothetical protein
MIPFGLLARSCWRSQINVKNADKRGLNRGVFRANSAGRWSRVTLYTKDDGPAALPATALTDAIMRTYMDAPGMSTYYLSLRADFQHEYVINLLLPLVCYVEGSLKMA